MHWNLNITQYKQTILLNKTKNVSYTNTTDNVIILEHWSSVILNVIKLINQSNLASVKSYLNKVLRGTSYE